MQNLLRHKLKHSHQAPALLRRVLGLTALLLLSGCGGGLSTPPNSPLTGQPQPAAPAAMPVLPPDQGTPPAQPAERQGTVLQYLAVAGSEPYVCSDNAHFDQALGTAQLHTSVDSTCWAMYRFTHLHPSEQVAMLSLKMREPIAERFFVGLSDFGEQAWHWISIDVILEQFTLDVPQEIECIGPGGGVYTLVAAPTGQYVELEQLELWFDIEAPHPVGLTVTDGAYMTAIGLEWDDPALTFAGLDYEAVQVIRYDQPNRHWAVIAELPAGVTSYLDVHIPDDNALEYDADIYYSVRTVKLGLAGPGAQYIAGRRRAGPGYFTATQGEHPDRVVLSWPPAPGVDSYRIDYRPQGGGEYTWLGTVTEGTSFTHSWNEPAGSECAPNTAYEYRLWPDSEDEAPWLPTATGHRQINAPVNLTASYGDYADRIDLTWQGNNPPGVDFKVYRDGQEAEDLAAEVGEATAWTDGDVDDCQHIYWVRSCYATEDHFFSLPAAGINATAGWQRHSVGHGDAGRYVSSPIEIDGRPAFAYSMEVTDVAPTYWQLRFAIASTAEPSSGVDWLEHVVHDKLEYEVALAVGCVNGMPCIVYSLAGEQSGFAQATTSSPSSSGDWRKHAVDISSYYLNMLQVAAKPVICCGRTISEHDSRVLEYAQALASAPTSADDWHVHTVVAGDLDQLSTFCSATVIDDRPAIAVVTGDGLSLLQANSSIPVHSSSWVSHLVDGTNRVHDGCRIISVAGKPLIAYWDIDQKSLLVARTETTTPSDAGDWAVHTVDYLRNLSGLVYDFPGVFAIDQMLGIAYFDYGGVYKIAMATKTDPADLTDWRIQPIGTVVGQTYLRPGVINSKPAVCIGWRENLEYARPLQ